jgi:hypothetical protein
MIMTPSGVDKVLDAFIAVKKDKLPDIRSTERTIEVDESESIFSATPTPQIFSPKEKITSKLI